MHSKFADWLMVAGLVIAVGGLELAVFHVISPKAGMCCFLFFFVVWAATFGDGI